jgi:hypothetical protein
MVLEAMPLQWFHKLNPGSIRGWEDLQRGESLRDYYRRLGELRAQVHDIIEWEVIEAFSYGILAKW